MTSPVELLALAEEVAREAGDLLVAGRDGLRGDVTDVATKTSPTDAVTAMDRAAEELIVSRLLAARPDDGVLGEEGTDHPARSGVRWVVDPLDGTVNYLYRLPAWSVSVAAQLDGVTVAGVVYDPTRGLLYRASSGGGSERNGSALRCSPAADLGLALVATGFSYESERRAEQARVLASVLPRLRDIRRAGSAALDLCTVAAGEVDGYFEAGLRAWDVAAGALITREAGAVVTGPRRGPVEGAVIAAGPGLHAELVDLLAAAGGLW